MIMHNLDNDTTYALSTITNKLVHINDVVRGLACNCVCPCCNQPMIANKGEKNQHYFSHERKGGNAFNKEECREETMHKLAIQIISDYKSVMLPSYEGIENARKVSFVSVEVEERNDRSDIQPDIVGITDDGKRYLIEIKYTHGVGLRKIEKIYSDDLTCVEIDISKQQMNNLEAFLLDSPDERKWINNKYGFDSIVDYYKKQGKNVRVVPIKKCKARENQIYPPCPKSLKEILYKLDTYIICLSTPDCSYIYTPEPIIPPIKINNQDKDIIKKDKDITRKNREQKNITPSTTQSSVRHQLREYPQFEPMGANEESNYKCIPEDFSIDEYYSNIHINDVFYEEEGVCYKVINFFRSNDILGVVLARIQGKGKYSVGYVTIFKTISLIHKWSRTYYDEHTATLALKNRLSSI